MSRNVKILTVALVCWCLVVSPLSAQNPAAAKPIIVDAAFNEDSKANIALLAQSVNEGEGVILIARLGNDESSRNLSRQRLEVVRDYLPVNPGLNRQSISDENIVMAYGERVRGKGRIEAYVRGRLFMVFVFMRNKNFAPEP